MHRLLLLIAILVLMGIGCAPEPLTPPEEPTNEIVVESPESEPVETETTTRSTEPQIYVQFVTNVHDWLFPEKSIETLNRLMDLHEQYEIPVEFHLTDTVTQIYVEQSPELMERIRSSAYVAVSYHVRPPHPIVSGFDQVGLMGMSSQERYETFMGFETHRLDMETGRYLSDEPGGFQFLKDQLGYAPRIVGQTNGRNGAEYSQVFEELGALFTVLHEQGGSDISEMIHGLNKRPEDQEVKLYEFRVPERFDPESEFADWTDGFDGTRDWFVNLKYHENNFYLTNTPFAPIYWEDWNNGRQVAFEPPYDTTASYDHIRIRPEDHQEAHWALYTEALEYVDQNSDWLTAINSVDLEQMLETIQ